ncbi:hypothetical protein CA51_03220 [Rosistilla oblonga]|uniref:Uncharacterized protein n=2 Tax=Rosistilla TaxID=2795779 RepID=A0A518IMT8_9BACT|nr:hypothetical protein EC9_04010 [Rosistilla ulvae]QDV10473.1 hypothetical protein CA51_03220 [Rosistilla oblonga]QDV54394.1 hypothetical protein Mal33_03480 [Rosistilla oblonga]
MTMLGLLAIGLVTFVIIAAAVLMVYGGNKK